MKLQIQAKAARQTQEAEFQGWGKHRLTAAAQLGHRNLHADPEQPGDDDPVQLLSGTVTPPEAGKAEE